MLEKLKIKVIYQDFIESVKLTEEQIKILNMLLQKETIVKISMEIGMSERTINYEIKKIKTLFQKYYEMRLSMTLLLLG